MRMNLELKHHCPDFRPIRTLLQNIGAKKVATKTQKDYFFNLPTQKKGVRPRMKLRIEKGRQVLVYYLRPDFSAHTATPAKLMLYPVHDKKFLRFFEAALGISAIVEKRRELWRFGATSFHLDRVRGVGNVFEVEVQTQGKLSPRDKKLFARYKKLFAPHLGPVIIGSNGDLLATRR